MTKEQKIMFFNKPSDWTYLDWLNSDARRLMNKIPKDVVEWIGSRDMTDEEKAEHPTHETTGGFLKVLDASGRAQSWWDSLTEENKDIIKALPNFDREIFYQCTGIKVEDISIHSPRVGGDGNQRVGEPGRKLFQSIPPVWGETRRIP